ncbi:MAG TPA: hypothetical protein VN193_14285 [Candidatus Angelobacter sp.]|nr:hypothetical protein [Candidatus Angelobacter sp.]
MELVRELLEEGRVRAGFPDNSGLEFRPWSLSTDEVMALIVQGWSKLGKAPSIGEIVWFDLTDRESWPPQRPIEG